MDGGNSYEDVAKAMHAKGVEFDVHLSRIKIINDELVERSSKVLEALQQLLGSVRSSDKKTCSVCYTRELSTCLVPCGHGFCTNCSDRARQRNPPRCFTCRARIADHLRVYVN